MISQWQQRWTSSLDKTRLIKQFLNAEIATGVVFGGIFWSAFWMMRFGVCADHPGLCGCGMDIMASSALDEKYEALDDMLFTFSKRLGTYLRRVGSHISPKGQNAARDL